MLLRRREFKIEDSLLDQLFQSDKHIKSIYSIAFALYVITLINIGAQNYTLTKKIFDYDLLAWAFSNFTIVLYGWVLNFCCTLLIYFLLPNTSRLSVLVFGWVYMILMFSISTLVCLDNKLPIASAMTLMSESIRLAMKSYAYIFAVVMDDAKLQSIKKDEEPLVTNYKYKGITHYLFFLFCPCMVYRDEYPLREYIRWKKAIKWLMDAVFCVIYLSMVWINLSYNELHQKRYKTSFFIHYFALIIPGTMISFLVFYGFLHSWLNFTSELLRYGDRKFYSEWWCSSTYSEYYRRWNAVIYDWLYAYLFCPLVSKLTQYVSFSIAKNISAVAVIWISAIIHEVILSCAFGFFYPILLVIYAVPGLLLFFVPKPKEGNWTNTPLNIALWFLLMVGYGMLLLFYCDEYYLRYDNKVLPKSPFEEGFWKSFSRSYAIEHYISHFK